MYLLQTKFLIHPHTFFFLLNNCFAFSVAGSILSGFHLNWNFGTHLIMYNHVLQSHHEKKEIPNQSLRSSQSIWMSHWSRTGYKMEPPHSHQPVNSKGKNKLFPFFVRPDTSLDVSSNYSKEYTVVPFAGATNITDIGKNVALMSRYSRNETLPPDGDGMLAVNNRAAIYYSQSMVPPIHSKTDLESSSPVRKDNLLMWNLPGGETPKRETNINIVDMPQDLKRQIKSNVLLSSFKHAVDGTNFHENTFGEYGASGLVVKGHSGNTNRLIELDSDPINFQGGSALFVHQQNSVHPCVSETRTNDNGLGMDKPSTSKCQKSLDHLSSKLPRSEGFDCPSYNREISGNTSQVLVTKKDELDPCRSAQYSGNKFGEFFSLSNHAFQKPQGLKLQPLWSSTDSEENGQTYINNLGTTKNEASAETDTMDMDILNGDVSTASNKEIAGSLKLQLSQATESSTRGAGDYDDHGANVNPALPAMSRFTDGDSSKTLSLDIKHLLPHLTKDSKYKFGFSSVSEPESRWVKRLKTDCSSHYHGTKSLQMEEIDCREKINGSFGQPMKLSSESRDKERRMEFLEQSQLFPKNVNSSSSGSMETTVKDLVSDSWIRRWCKNQTPLQKKPIDVSSSSRLFEPQILKESFDELRKKQFPSVAAMALMGKAMNGFQQCEFSKRGSLVVWNTKGF